MKIINRFAVILITFLFGYNSVYSQTQADVKMGEILNSGDLFQLRTEVFHPFISAILVIVPFGEWSKNQMFSERFNARLKNV